MVIEFFKKFKHGGKEEQPKSETELLKERALEQRGRLDNLQEIEEVKEDVQGCRAKLEGIDKLIKELEVLDPEAEEFDSRIYQESLGMIKQALAEVEEQLRVLGGASQEGEVVEEEGAPTEKIGRRERIENFFQGAKEMITSEDSRKALASGAYKVVTKVAAVKSITDAVGYVTGVRAEKKEGLEKGEAEAGWGNFYEIRGQNVLTKEIVETVKNEQKIEDKKAALIEKINKRDITEENKKRLIELVSRQGEDIEILTGEKDQEIEKAVKAFTKIKELKTQSFFDGLQTLASSVDFVASRAFISTASVIMEKRARLINKRKLEELRGEESGQTILHEMTVGVYNELVDKWKSGKKLRAIGSVTSFGLRFTGIGFASLRALSETGITGGLKETIGEISNESDFISKLAKGGETMVTNVIDNAIKALRLDWLAGKIGPAEAAAAEVPAEFEAPAGGASAAEVAAIEDVGEGAVEATAVAEKAFDPEAIDGYAEAATVNKGEGFEHAFIRQLRVLAKQPEYQEYFSQPGNSPERLAHLIAMDQDLVKGDINVGFRYDPNNPVQAILTPKMEDGELKFDVNLEGEGLENRLYKFKYTPPPEPELEPEPALTEAVPEAGVEAVPLGRMELVGDPRKIPFGDQEYYSQIYVDHDGNDHNFLYDSEGNRVGFAGSDNQWHGHKPSGGWPAGVDEMIDVPVEPESEGYDLEASAKKWGTPFHIESNTESALEAQPGEVEEPVPGVDGEILSEDLTEDLTRGGDKTKPLESQPGEVEERDFESTGEDLEVEEAELLEVEPREAEQEDIKPVAEEAKRTEPREESAAAEPEVSTEGPSAQEPEPSVAEGILQPDARVVGNNFQGKGFAVKNINVQQASGGRLRVSGEVFGTGNDFFKSKLNERGEKLLAPVTKWNIRTGLQTSLRQLALYEGAEAYLKTNGRTQEAGEVSRSIEGLKKLMIKKLGGGDNIFSQE